MLKEISRSLVEGAIDSITVEGTDYFKLENQLQTRVIGGSVWYSKYYGGGAYICVLKWFYHNKSIVVVEFLHDTPNGWDYGPRVEFLLSDPEFSTKLGRHFREILDRNHTERRPR
jgi:hypothetical protein